MLAAHPGRALTMVEWIDPAVVDEQDMYATNPALDMYNPANGPPYDRGWLTRYRAAQRARNDRITDWVLGRLAALDADLDQDRIKDEPFIVYRTVADPRFLDLSLDPSDRAVSNTRRSRLWSGPISDGFRRCVPSSASGARGCRAPMVRFAWRGRSGPGA